MKFIYQITVPILLGIFAVFSTANAQLYEVPLDEKIRESTLIVEGKVIGQESYYSTDGEVYTANKVVVSSVLKGRLDEEHITVTTWGGETESESITWSHMLWLGEGEEGVFFLEPTQVPESDNRDLPSPAFDVHAGMQGFLRYSRNDKGVLTASEPFSFYEDVAREVFGHIAEKTGQQVTYFRGDERHKSGIRYFFKQASFSGSTIGFEIYVNSLYGDKELYQAGAVLKYNPAFFGNSIASSGNLQIYNGGISASTAYSFTSQDLSQAEVKIELKSDASSVNNLTTIGTGEQYLGKGELTILDITADPGIYFDLDAMGLYNKFYEGGQEKAFEIIIVDTDFKLGGFHLAPQIDSIRPLSLRAGVGDVLTIYGSGFEDGQPNNGRVQFSHALHGDNGNWVEPLETDYLQWDDDIIKVQVPSVGYFQFNNTAEFDNYAGTGDMRVKIGGSNSNKKDLTIRFCATNDAQEINGMNHRYPFELRNYNGEGGYDIYFTNDFKGLGGGVEAFKRAICTLQEATGVNYKIRELSTIPQDSLAYSCKVDYGELNLPSGTPSAVKSAIFRLDLAGCFSGDTIKAAFCQRWEIFFKKSGVDWSTAQGVPPINWNNEYDLETVALHELLHSLWLEHSNNQDDALYWRQSEYKRDLQPNDLEAGQYAMGISTDDLTCPSGKMIAHEGDCLLNPSFEFVHDANVKLSPNPTKGAFSVEFPEQGFTPISAKLYHISGQFISELYFTGESTLWKSVRCQKVFTCFS